MKYSNTKRYGIRQPRRLWLITGLVSVMLMLLASSLPAQESKISRRQKILESLKILGTVYERIMENYVDEVDPRLILEGCIEGMLEELDEHSQYLPPVSYEDLMLQTEGEFGGLGITINIRDHYPTVVSPIEGTPAYYMGIQGGDQIVEIEGEPTYDFTSRDAVKLLRGEPGTKVTIGIKREAVDDPIPFTITRDVIKVESVPYAFMIGDIGYIRVQHFARTTADELREKLDDLGDEGMRGLILDLRWNPGGLLEAAKEVCEVFLEKGQLLVFTKGRLRSQNVSYYSEPSDSVHDKVPMLVLVNGSSASASEIVSAALQDHDSALVVGKTTFGKGSVQTVFRVTEEEAIKLTTAHYYTPSGRSIHMDRTDEQEDPDAAASDDVELEPSVQEVPRHEKEQFRTDMGRIVYGGGGITPDIEIEQAKMEDFEIALERDGALFSYASYYAARHEGITGEFETSSDIIADFRTYLAGREKIEEYLGVFELSLTDSLYDTNREYLQWGIRREIMRRQFGPEAAYKVAIEKDVQLHEALALFEDAANLDELLQLAAAWNEEQLHQAAVETETEQVPVGN